jgi:hydroxyacylglutathione hydrolase
MFEVSAIKAFSDNYIWTLIKDGEVTVVDPGDPEPVKNYLNEKGLNLKNILITHHHFDHTGGIEELTDIYGCEVYGPDGGHIKGIGVKIQDNQEFTIMDVTFKAFATPGHTLDHLSYYVEDDSNPLLFCGDTLFSGGCGRLFEGSPKQMHNSLSRLAELPGKTKVFCTHEYTESNLRFAIAVEPNNRHIKDKIEEVQELRRKDLETLPSTISEELNINPFLRCNQNDVINSAEYYCKTQLSESHEVLGAIREWKDNF